MNVTEQKNFFDLASEQKRDPWAAWNSKEMEELRANRKHPCFLQTSDKFEFPPLKEKPEQVTETNNKHQTFLRPTPKVIDVYLGFMDEEVNARLKAVLDKELQEKDKKKRRPVILIERGKVKPGDPILEWPEQNYPKEAADLKVSQVSTGGKILRLKGSEQNELSLSIPKNSGEEIQSEGVSTAPDDVLARVLGVMMEQDISADVQALFKNWEVGVKRYIDLLVLLRKCIIDPERKKKPKVALPQAEGEESIWLSVVRFSIGDDRQAPIIVIRTPEMGLQASLMSPYVAFLFKAISFCADQLARIQMERWRKIANPIYESREESWKRTLAWPIRVCQFGAQGSTSADEAYLPGKVLPVIAALYVGAEIASDIILSGKDKKKTFVGNGDKAPEFNIRWKPIGKGQDPKEAYKAWKTERRVRVYSVVSLCTPAGVYDFLREEYRGKDPDPVGAAEQKAKDKLQEIAKTPPKMPAAATNPPKGPLAEEEKALLNGKPDLKQFIQKIKQDSQKLYGREGAVTLTTGFFGGEDEKNAAKDLGIVSVGMEDYHVLRVLRTALATGTEKDSDYPLIMNWRIDRINCDPLKIPDKLIKDFNKSIKEEKLTKSKYRDIIIWGLHGVLGPLAPECVIWKFPETLDDKLKRNQFLYTYNDLEHNREFTPNPLYVEIATDFLKDLSDQKKGKNDDIKTTGKAVLDRWKKNPEENEDLRQKIDDFLDCVAVYHGLAFSAGFRVQANKAVNLVFSDNKTKIPVVCGKDKWTPVNLLLDQTLKVSKQGGALQPIQGRKFSLGDAEITLTLNDEAEMKTWLRPGGKWKIEKAFKDAKSFTVQDLGDKTFEGADVDRAFYKSCNLMALQTLAGSGLL